ncbi:beta-galactosidase [Streptomyces sp. NPDC049627]|uniref:glycoside hydrolase family 35 protein n=1 Tax=Streptomyces sp. NPDC049627 TaxID=3365595 RepID=UPI0037B95696
MPSFDIENGSFRLDGAPFRILSGALHYFRVHPGHVRHRLEMLRAMGLNTVETYVPWNYHEPRTGAFTRLDELDFFLTESKRAGLHAIVRPGPYICAEWDNGGLPWWVPGQLRTSDPVFLEHVERWFDVLLPLVAEHQVTRGGNVLMVQVENEYGSYGSDHAYLQFLADVLTGHGIEVPLFTADGPEDHMLTGGSLPGLPATGTFGSQPARQLAALRRHRPDDPAMCMELWIGWFDHWGRKRNTRSARDAADTLEELLAAGASVNLYMAHGGTNFGLWAGANRDLETGEYLPHATSYDYDAPIGEHGAPTPKFWAFREVLARYRDEPAPPPPPAPPVLVPTTVELTEWACLDALARPAVTRPTPPTFEELGLGQGLVRYRLDIPGPRQPYPLIIDGLRDRAHLSVDGERVSTLHERSEPVEIAGPARVELLVESLGRVGYGPTLGEAKGILGGIRHDRQYLHQITAEAIPLDDLAPLSFTEGTAAAPAFLRGVLEVTDPGDTFLALPGWSAGVVWVNGFCLGRYRAEGPQRTLYLPGPLLRPGRNELIVLELDRIPSTPNIELRDQPELGD